MSPRTRNAAWALAGVIVLGLAGGALTSGSAVPEVVPGSDVPETVPETAELARTPVPDAVARLAATGFITSNAQASQAADGSAQPPQVETWTLRGIASGAGGSAVFQSTTDAAPKLLAVGDSLPDGRKIAAIEPDRVELTSGTCRSEIRLFSPVVPADCPPPAAPNSVSGNQ